MISNYRLIHAQMRAMVVNISCYEEASIILDQAIGTISKKVNGSAAWTIEDMIRLEEYAKKSPVTKILSRKKEASHECQGTLINQLAFTAREIGNAISMSQLATRKDWNPETSANAVVEIDAAIDALRGLRCKMNDKGCSNE
jgi:hypothetical protein